MPDGAPDRKETVAEMLRAIAGLSDPDDTAVGGRFKRDILEQMRQGDRDASTWVEHRLADRDRELCKSGND
jgi:hypothetical protein